MRKPKGYRAKGHKELIKLKSGNSAKVHHPDDKIPQIENILKGKEKLKIVEFFAGYGNLTEIYEKFGKVTSYDKLLGTGDSFKLVYKLIGESKKYNVIDLDNYGWSNRMFPHIFLLHNPKKTTFLFLTIPKPFVNVINGMTAQHLKCYYGETNPSYELIIDRIKNYALMHWYDIDLMDSIDLGRLWRVVFSVKKVKATEYTGTKNR